jgi:hypothetical protein
VGDDLQAGNRCLAQNQTAFAVQPLGQLRMNQEVDLLQLRFRQGVVDRRTQTLQDFRFLPGAEPDQHHDAETKNYPVAFAPGQQGQRSRCDRPAPSELPVVDAAAEEPGAGADHPFGAGSPVEKISSPAAGCPRTPGSAA